MAYDLGTARGTIELEYNGRGAVDRAEADMHRLSRSSKKNDDDFKKLGKTFSNFFGVVGKTAKFSGIAIALGSAAIEATNLGVQLLGAVPALTSIASLSAALPGLLAGGGAAAATLLSITHGLGDAFKEAFSNKAADVKKLQASLKNLAPSAAAFVVGVTKARPALQSFQKGIQEAFFSSAGLTQAVPQAVSVLKQLRPSLQGMAQDFAGITKEAVKFGLSSKTVDFLSKSISTFRNALGLVTPSLVPILEGLRAVGTVGLPLLNRLGGAVSGVATKFADWLNAIASDGRLQGWINTALSTLNTLGGIVKNVATIFGNLFSIASQTSGGLLNNLQTLTGQIAKFTSSAQGMAAIQTFFQGVGAAANALAPVLTTLAGVLLSALGPALGQLATSLGPVLLDIVNQLAPAFAPLTKAIADVVIALAPLLPPLATLISLVAQLLSGALSSLAAELAPVATLIGQTLVTALQTFQPILTSMINTALPLAAQFGQQLLQAFLPLAPVILQLAQQLAQSLVPQLPRLTAAAVQLVPQIVALAQAVGTQLAAGITAILPYVPQLVTGFVNLALTFDRIMGVVIGIITAFVSFGTTLTNLISSVVSFGSNLISSIGGAISGAYNAVVSTGGQILAWFSALPGRVIGFISSLGSSLPDLIGGAIKAAAFQFGAGIGQIVTFAVALPGRVAGAISSLISRVGAIIRSTWSAATNITLSAIASIVGFVRGLPGRAAGAMAALPGLLRSIAANAWSAVRNAFSSGIAAVAGLARTVGGRILSAIGNLGSLLVGAGREAINGLISGIRSGIGAVASAARSLGSSVLAGIKSTLKISSPSKAMITIGRFVTQGLEKGLLGSAAQVQAAANKLANYVRDAFSDKLIKRSQRNSVLGVLATGTRQMLSLVNQSNTVAARLKTAQSNLADVQKSYNDVFNSAVQKTQQTFQLVTSGQQFVNLDATKRRFQTAVQQAKDFATNIQALTKRGLSKDLLQQLVDAGATDGGAMAKALANSSDQTLKEFNTLQGQLNAAANTVGKTTAEALYGAGLRAAQGLVTGLQRQQAAIDKVMNSIADSMVARIKRALKIKSPSRVMFNLGKFTSQGLLEGLRSLQREVAQTAESLATSSIVPTVKLGLDQRFANGTQQPGFAQANPSAPSFTVNQNIQALPGMNTRDVATYSIRKISLALRSGVNASALPVPVPQGA